MGISEKKIKHLLFIHVIKLFHFFVPTQNTKNIDMKTYIYIHWYMYINIYTYVITVLSIIGYGNNLNTQCQINR